MAATEQVRARKLFRNHVPRPRLTRLLDEASAQITVIVAPAGYGKTTLAAEWTADKITTWYRPTRASGDIAAFSLELAEAASKVLPDADSRLRRRLHAGDDEAFSARALAELLAEDLQRWPAEAWLVIDDYHEVSESGAVAEFIDWLLDLTLVRVLVTSRVRPSWASARRLLYGRAFEIGREELAMTVREAESVLGDRPVEAAQALTQRAQGWPALISLAALVAHAELPEERVSGALFRYVAEEVFGREPSEVQRFMLFASVPAHVDVRLIAGFDVEAHESLLRLRNEGLLQAPHGDADRFHPLVREFLRQKLKTDEPRAFAAVARLSSLAARERRHWEEAFELAVESGDLDVAAAVVADASRELLNAGRIETVERWLEIFGDDRDSRLELVRLQVLERRGGDLELRERASKLARALRPGDERVSDAWYYVASAEELLGNERGALQSGLRASATAETPKQRALALWLAANCAARLGDDVVVELMNELEVTARHLAEGPFILASAKTLVGAMYRHDLRGLLAQVEPLLTAVPSDRTRLRLLRAAAYLCVAHADYVSAQRFIEDAAVLVDDLHLGSRQFAYCLPIRANAQIGLRDFGGAERTLGALAQLARVQPHRGFEGEYRNALAKLQIARGELRRVLVERDTDPLVQPPPMAMTEHAGLAAIVSAALGEIERSRTERDVARTAGCAIEGEYYARFAYAIEVARQGPTDAYAGVRKVVDEAFRAGFPDAFVTAYRAYPPLLQIAASAEEIRTQLRKVTSSANDEVLGRRAGLLQSSGVEGTTTGGELTKREREVLSLIANGLTNADIAKQLVIAESTAKLHVHHIFEKLGVNTRTQAAIRARDMQPGVLEP
jgi:LuxR family maltose regulon positive regulatory protein